VPFRLDILKIYENFCQSLEKTKKNPQNPLFYKGFAVSFLLLARIWQEKF
jgi:hypothetical protein